MPLNVRSAARAGVRYTSCFRGLVGVRTGSLRTTLEPAGNRTRASGNTRRLHGLHRGACNPSATENDTAGTAVPYQASPLEAVMKRHLRRRVGRTVAFVVACCLIGSWIGCQLGISRSSYSLTRKRTPRALWHGAGHETQLPRVALLSTTTAAYARRFAYAVQNKVLYAKKWSATVDFLLDSYPYHWLKVAATPERHAEPGQPLPPHYNRLFALERLLKQDAPYDWFMYVDVDAVITNFSIPVQTFLQGISPEHYVVVHDGPEINSGAFLLRNTPESLQFVRNWIALGTQWPQASLDQTALWHLLYLHAAFPSAPPELLLRYAHTYPCRASVLFPVHFVGSPALQRAPAAMLRHIEGCWRYHMARLGYGYGQRNRQRRQQQQQAVYYRHEAPGFNFYASVGRPENCALRHASQLWRPGDWLIQDSGYGLEDSYETVNETVLVRCIRPPCSTEIWKDEAKPGMIASWDRQALLLYPQNRWHRRGPDDSEPFAAP